MKGTQGFTDKGPWDSQKCDNDLFSLDQHFGIIIALNKCLRLLELFLRFLMWSMDLLFQVFVRMHYKCFEIL